MSSNDEYIVYIDEGKTSRYYKNKKLHREAGPAYVCTIDKEKYTNLSDEDLYRKVYKPVIPEEEVKAFHIDYFHLSGGNSIPVASPFKSTYYGSYYYLEGIKYSKKEFDTILFKNKMECELSQLDNKTSKKPKV